MTTAASHPGVIPGLNACWQQLQWQQLQLLTVLVAQQDTPQLLAPPTAAAAAAITHALFLGCWHHPLVHYCHLPSVGYGCPHPQNQSCGLVEVLLLVLLVKAPENG